MPAIETFERHQPAVVWPSAGIDAYGRYRVEDTPHELMTRWEVGEREVIDPEGNPIRVNVGVVTAESLRVGDVLWQGTLEDWDPNDQSEMMQVVGSSITPDLKGRNIRRVYGLMKYQRSLPPYSE